MLSLAIESILLVDDGHSCDRTLQGGNTTINLDRYEGASHSILQGLWGRAEACLGRHLRDSIFHKLRGPRPIAPGIERSLQEVVEDWYGCRRHRPRGAAILFLDHLEHHRALTNSIQHQRGIGQENRVPGRLLAWGIHAGN